MQASDLSAADVCRVTQTFCLAPYACLAPATCHCHRATTALGTNLFFGRFGNTDIFDLELDGRAAALHNIELKFHLGMVG